jgi:glycerophosphoryl diester phosphodiesterase
MKIIGHRGAAGHELENTLASLQHAVQLGVWAIEFDVRKTKDGKLVVFHDSDLKRVSEQNQHIDDLTLAELQKIPLLTGSHIPTLAEAMEVIGSKRAVIELKDAHCAEELVRILADFPKANVTVVSFKLGELSALREMQPGLRLYALERTKPFDIIHLAKRLGFNGVGFNFWLLNPLTYWLCNRSGLEMYVYTVDIPILARYISRFYPSVGICTNYPERFLKKTA